MIERIRGNKVDEIMGDIMDDCSTVHIEKVSENYYQIGSKRTYIKYNRDLNQVNARDRGGKFIEIRKFLKTYQDQFKWRRTCIWNHQNLTYMGMDPQQDMNEHYDNI